MRRLRLAAVAASFTLLACGGAGSASAATPRDFYGIVQFAFLNDSDFARMGDAKVGSLRFNITWSAIQKSRNGAYNFTHIDDLVKGAASQGIEILPTMFGTPPFENHGCSTQTCQRHIITTSTAIKDWQKFLTAAAQRYGPNGTYWQQFPAVPYHPITRWQLWNEQNSKRENNSPKAYAKLVKSGDQALSKVDPNATVVLGGMFGTPPGPSKNFAWNYLKALYKAGAASHFDGVDIHPYAVKPSDLAQPIKKMRAVLKSHHDASTPLYITEIGWGSSKKKHPGTGGRGAAFNVSPAKQKSNLTSSFKILTSHRSSWKLGGVFWFTWKDPTNPPDGLCAFCYSSGLYKANGTTAKPSLSGFKRFTSFTTKAQGKRER